MADVPCATLKTTDTTVAGAAEVRVHYHASPVEGSQGVAIARTVWRSVAFVTQGSPEDLPLTEVCATLSQDAFARLWDTPEEDEAWRDL